MAITTEPTLSEVPDPAPSAAVIETSDPRSGAPLAVVPDLDAAGVAAAVARARGAAAAWAALGFRARTEHLLTVRDRMLDRAEELVEVICAETGKQRAEAVTTELMAVAETIDSIEYFAFPNTFFFRGLQFPMVYRFLPSAHSVDECTFELLFLRHPPTDGPVPPPAEPVDIGIADRLFITSASWLAGFVVVGVPGGIGIRESVFTALAGTALTPGVAVSLALASRVVFIAVDLVGALVANIIARTEQSAKP